MVKFEKAMILGSVLDLGAGFVDHEWNNWWQFAQCSVDVNGCGRTLLSALVYAIWGVGKLSQLQTALGLALSAVEQWFQTYYAHLL
jgi:hypothetical protein